jgi:hypothetical protein
MIFSRIAKRVLILADVLGLVKKKTKKLALYAKEC